MHFLYKRQVNRFCIKRFCKYCRFCKDLQSYQNFISSIVDSIYLYLAFDFDSLVYSIQQVFNIVHSITSKPIGFSRLQAMTSLRGYFLICLYVCVCMRARLGGVSCGGDLKAMSDNAVYVCFDHAQ